MTPTIRSAVLASLADSGGGPAALSLVGVRAMLTW
jgi:hypothetical protein